ncbi:MAG: hydrogenase [Rhodoferax sp.]|nr:hydrogenase [Rhodoferax sp.]
MTTETEVQAHPLLAQLAERHGEWVDADSIANWRSNQSGDHVLLFAGDPVRFPEALDVAVVLPELQKASKSSGRPFAIAVAVPEGAEALALKFGSNRWPTLMFFRDGQYVTTLSGMHDWSDYLRLVAQALDTPVGRAPTVGIPVVSANPGSSTCH